MAWGHDDFWKGFHSKNGANALIGLGTGLLSGNTFAKGLAAGGQGWMQGAAVDQQYADAEAERLKETEQTNATRSWLEQQGYTDLVPLVDAGQGSLAFEEALRRKQPKAQPDPFTLSPGEIRYDGSGNVIAQGPEPTLDPKELFGFEKDLAAQYGQQDPLKTFTAVRNGYERVRASSTLGTGAGDISMIFAYMKMLDPTSVVREGEFATAENAGGAGEQIANLYNRVLSGERLTPELRQEFLAAADALYAESAQNLSATNTQFDTRSRAWGVDPSRFVVQPETYDPLAPSAAGGPSLESLLDKYR